MLKMPKIFSRKTQIPKKLRRSLAMVLMVGFLSVGYSQPARADLPVIDLVAAGHWITSNIQWLADEAWKQATQIYNDLKNDMRSNMLHNDFGILAAGNKKIYNATGDATEDRAQRDALGKIAADQQVKTVLPTHSGVCETNRAMQARNEAGSMEDSALRAFIQVNLDKDSGPNASPNPNGKDVCALKGQNFDFGTAYFGPFLTKISCNYP